MKNGNELGNHTFSHLDFNNVSDSLYFDNIIKGEVVIRKLMQEYGKTLKYFRHPYLHMGMGKSRAEHQQEWQTEMGKFILEVFCQTK